MQEPGDDCQEAVGGFWTYNTIRIQMAQAAECVDVPLQESVLR